jgi:hypothetical protein
VTERQAKPRKIAVAYSLTDIEMVLVTDHGTYRVPEDIAVVQVLRKDGRPDRRYAGYRLFKEWWDRIDARLVERA